jgi:starch-binding outer membrane protein, SusD/RagB family
MRKILVVILLFGLSSCSSYLDVEPSHYVSSDKVFDSKENFYSALIGCYDALQNEWYYGRTLLIIGDLASDVSYANGTKVEFKEIDDNAILSDNIAINSLWEKAYEAINRVNYLLYFIDEVPNLEDDVKNDFIGQLKFLRAFHYYNLVRLFGDSPLKTTPTLDDNEFNFKPRTSKDSIYSIIIDDLEFAISNLSNTKPVFASIIASQTLLSSVYLTIENYQLAFDISNQALNANNFLEPNYSNIFSDVEVSKEILFYIPFSSDDKNRLAEYHYPRQLGGRHENAPSQIFVDQVDERDARFNLVAENYQDRYYCNKYANLSTGADKIIVFRTSELYFIRAEALLNLEGFLVGNIVLNDINTIRQRARLSLVNANSIEELYDILYKEKMIEFAFEGKRWFELIRTGQAIEKVPSVTDRFQMLFPIPIHEIAANPFISENDQNDGY